MQKVIKMTMKLRCKACNGKLFLAKLNNKGQIELSCGSCLEDNANIVTYEVND